MEDTFEPYRNWRPDEDPEMVEAEAEALFSMMPGTPEGIAFVRYFRRVYGDAEILGVIRRVEREQLRSMVETAIVHINEQSRKDMEDREMNIDGKRQNMADIVRVNMLREGETDDELFNVFSPNAAPTVTEKFGETLSPIADKFEPGYSDPNEPESQRVKELNDRMLSVAQKIQRTLQGFIDR